MPWYSKKLKLEDSDFKIKVICMEEPDISYTSNKKLTKYATYIATYDSAKLGQFGKCELYDIYDEDKKHLGQYYARDFVTVADHRAKQLEDILGD